MPVTPQENEKYRQFVNNIAIELGIFDFSGEQIIWHYTDGAGFLGILQSATVFATQVASLNDSRETKYATDMFKTAVEALIEERKEDPEAIEFFQLILEYVKEEPDTPTHGISKFFITSFSAEEDNVVQWDRYGKKNAYAIGFYARGFWREPNSQIYRVVYDREKQMKATKRIAAATLDFFREGLTDERKSNPEQWGKDFYAAWDEWIYKLAPLAKDPTWSTENEFRLVHELKSSEFPRVRFAQKDTMLARYIALDTSNWVKRRQPLLPIAKVLIGHGNHPAFTKISAKLLLEQMGYVDIPVETTKCTLVRV